MLVGCACLALIIPAESLTLVPVAAGDILLDFSLDQPVYLQGEPIIGILNIYNDMDDPIVIWPDSEDASTRLECRIEWQGDERVPARKQAPLVDRLGVNPDQTESVMLMLSEHYNLYEIGRYRAVMELHWQGKIHTSRMQIIDVVRGLEIDSIQRGVRGYPDKPRQYSLRYLTRNQREQLFLVVDDDRYHFGSFLLGPVIRFQKPGMTLNRDGRLVVYHQSSPVRYTRSVFQSDPSEVRFIDQVYVNGDGTPFHQQGGAPVGGGTNQVVVDDKEASLPKPAQRSGGLFGRWFNRE